MALILTMMACAQTKIDGIYYDLNSLSQTAAVRTLYEDIYYSGIGDVYSGDVIIPSKVTYNGVTYNVTSINEGAFYHCSGLTSITIPSSVTSIDQHAFKGCTSLTSLVIPNSVTSIGIDAFSVCSGLTSIKIESGNNVYDSRGNCNAIIETTSNTLITGCKNTTIPNSVTSIGGSAFEGCIGLTSVTIPNSVTSIGNYAFSGCTSLTSLVIPHSVTSLGSYAFSGTTWYNNQPDGMVYLGNFVYEYKGQMPANTHIIIREGTIGIAGSAFAGCSGLTSIFIPNSVTFIGGSAFAICSGLASVSIPYGVTSIDSQTFYRCSSLTSISIPNSVTSIGIDAFMNCTGLTSIAIPNGVTSIGSDAFSGCSSLSSVTIPNSVTSIGGYAFAHCSSLSSVISEISNPFEISNYVFYSSNKDIYATASLTIPVGKKSAYLSTAGWNRFTNIVEAGETGPDQPGQIQINDIYYNVTESGEAEVVSVDNGVTSITIPSNVSHNNTSYKVMAIAKDAFEDCKHLAAVIWEPEVQFNAKVNNPNFLLYVSDEKYASRSVKNVVVNSVAESIELTDAANGNDFYCPRAFKAKSIVYSHNYQMETGIGDSRGWETIVLPFDVQKYTHATKGELESFTTWSKGSSKKPFWLFELTADGYKDVAGIKANTPYIISMPNNIQYEQQYQIPGVVTFSASNVEVQKSDNLKSVSYQGRSFVPTYANKSDDNYLTLNVNNYYVTNPSKDIAGSKFIRGLRAVHPFEAYMTTTDNTRSIDVMDGLTTAIRGIQMVKDEASTIKVYDTRGVLLKTATGMDDVRNGLKAGVYIVNGKKMIIK